MNKPSPKKSAIVKLFLFASFLLTQCNLGHKEVKYNEMAAPPKLYADGYNLIVRTENSKINTSFLIYEIQPTFDQGDKIIYLKGLEAIGRKLKNEFKVNIAPIKPDSISSYKIFWVDPDNSKTALKIEMK